MAVTSQVLLHTPIPGHSYPAANKTRQISKWVEAKDNVRNTPVTDWMGSASETFEELEYEIGQSYMPFITTTLGADTANNSQTITVASTALLRVGDTLEITPYYSGSTTELNNSSAERTTILSIDSATTLTADRDEAQTSTGSWPVIVSGSVVRVVSRAQNYNEPFPDAITFRGDLITNYTERFDSGELTYDLAAVPQGDFEAPNGHYMRDVMYWKKALPLYREDAFIKGIKRAGNYTAQPKIPYRVGGMIWYASQVAANITAINGQLSLFDFSDIFESKSNTHTDGPGDTMWVSPRVKSIWSEILLPYKGMFGPRDTVLDMRTTKVVTEWGDIMPRAAQKWPDSKVLITSKSDWSWGHKEGMNWTYVERGPEELGAFQKSWTMGGDFGLVCKNITRQILFTGIDTRIDLYPGRTNFN